MIKLHRPDIEYICINISNGSLASRNYNGLPKHIWFKILGRSEFFCQIFLYEHIYFRKPCIFMYHVKSTTTPGVRILILEKINSSIN